MYGGYRVLKELDFGSYGRVYKVEKEGVEYALKEFYRPEDYSGIPSPSEISLLFSFSCPNIVKAIDFFRQEGKYYLVMELAQDNMINHICNLLEKEELDTSLVRSYCADVARGVDYMHTSGFAHCDIKPANCLVFGERVKLADLGFSFLVKSNLNYPVTPAFSPPETLHENVQSILDKRYLSFLSYFTQKRDYLAIDVWSLGVTFAYFLTGNYLFGNSTQEETLNHMVSYIRYPVNYLTEFGVPEEWIPLLLKMLKPHVQDRISARQVLYFLQEEEVSSCFSLQPLPVSGLEQCSLIDQGRNYIYSYFTENRPEACFSLSALNAYYYVCSQRPDLKQEPKLLAFVCLLLFSKVYARYIVDDRECGGEYTREQIEDTEWELMQVLKNTLFFDTLANQLGQEKAKYFYLFQRDYTNPD